MELDELYSCEYLSSGTVVVLIHHAKDGLHKVSGIDTVPLTSALSLIMC